MNISDMFGLSPTGLGPVTSAFDAAQNSGLAQQKTLSDLTTAGLNQQAQALTNQEDAATSQTKIQAMNAKNLGDVTAQNVGSYQKMAGLMGQVANSFSGIPVDQRVQALTTLGSKFPGMSDSPIFKQLLATDPNNLPSALKDLGDNFATQATDYIQKSKIQGQADTAALQRVNAQQAGANSRTAMDNAAAMARQQASDATRMNIATNQAKMMAQINSYEKAATHYHMLAADPNLTPEQQQQASTLAKQFDDLTIKTKTAALYPKQSIDSQGNIINVSPYGVNPPAAQPTGPKVGTIEGGYKYLGGDPSSPKSWEKQ